jgi:hypothetical protein
MSPVIENFMRWWNWLAQGNGKAKFRTQREAFEFIQRTYKKSGGPNCEIRAMRKEYEEIRRARAARRKNTGSNKGRDQAAVA